MSYPYWVHVATDKTVLDTAYQSDDPLVIRLTRMVEQRDKEIESWNAGLNRTLEAISTMRSCAVDIRKAVFDQLKPNREIVRECVERILSTI